MNILGLPTPDGRQLWMVRLVGRRNAFDGRDHYTTTVDIRRYIMAANMHEATAPFTDEFVEIARNYQLFDDRIIALPIPVEMLTVSIDRRLLSGNMSGEPLLEPIELGGPNAPMYRLAVVLVET